MTTEVMKQALDALSDFLALIKYQYSGSREAMSDLQYADKRAVFAITALRQAISEASLDTSQSHACTWPACKSEAVEQEPTFDEVMLLAAACMTDAASAAFAGYGNLSNQEIDALAARATAMLVDFNSVAALEKAVRNLTSPPAREWTGLTEDEAHVCFKSANVWHAVEAKLKEKNHG